MKGSRRTRQFAALNALKQQNPSLTVLVSVGGWLWSGNFSDAVLTKQSRSMFIDSVVAFIEKYNLDGLDIDWEYPDQVGAGNHFRAEDKQNYTEMLKELRQRFNQEQKTLHRRLYLSIAPARTRFFAAHGDGQCAEVCRYGEPDGLRLLRTGGRVNDRTQRAAVCEPADPKQDSADRSR